MLRYGLSMLLLLSLASVRAQLTYERLYVDYDSAWLFKNLKIVPIRLKGGGGMPGGASGAIPLNEALAKGLVSVSERGTASTENVHWLRFNTRTDKPVYISGGEIVSGGRQDRMVIRDTILQPSQKDQYVPVMCVEEDRWSDKEKKFAYGRFANPHLRKILDSTRNQVLIWREVERQLTEGAIKNTTLAYLSRNLDKKFVAASDEYFNFFWQKFIKADSNIVGFVAISGNRVLGSDIFDGTDLFYHQLDPLLHSYIDDAVLLGAPVTLPNPPLVRYMDKLLKDEASQEAFVKGNGKIFRQGSHVIHVNSLSGNQ